MVVKKKTSTKKKVSTKKSYLDFKDTSEVKITDKLVDNVIGQDDALEIINKAAAQKRHVLLLGEPGTGKSMLGKALAEILATKDAVDILAYSNQKDENNPIVKITKAGDGQKIVDKSRAHNLKNMSKGQGTILIIFIILGIAISYYHYWYLLYWLGKNIRLQLLVRYRHFQVKPL